MYICLCCGLHDTQISTAVASGAGTVEEVFRHLGETQQCELCTNDVSAFLKSSAPSGVDAGEAVTAPLEEPMPGAADS